jgi:hypothetical protein
MWKSWTVGLVGAWLLIAPFVVPSGTNNVYNNWLLGAIATNAALMMSGNRKWERPVAAAAGIWLFMSGFVPSMLSGGSVVRNDLAIAAVLILAALSARTHLKEDYEMGRPVLTD